jgi:hypothetical protein
MNRKFLMAQLNQELAAEGRKAEANWAARQMEEAYDSIEALNHRYNKLLDGKWDGMMAHPTSFTPTCQYYQKPEVKRFEGAGEKAVVLTPLRAQTSKGCQVIDLKSHHQQRPNSVRLIKGLGYDGSVLQFVGRDTIEYQFPAQSDSIDVIIYSVPFWPLYKDKSNSIYVKIDDSPMQVFENKFKEYDRTWKDQVMRNGAVCRLRFAIDKNRPEHLLRLAGDPGQMIQRVILDWGGLNPSYIGPSI